MPERSWAAEDYRFGFNGQEDDLAVRVDISQLLIVPICKCVTVSPNIFRQAINTRSSAALIKAGVPINKWKMVNKTGVKKFEKGLTKRLKENKLSSSGTSAIKERGSGLYIIGTLKR